VPEHDTVETPLPPGTIPDQQNVITQEIPAAKMPFPEIQLVSPVRVELPPLHLINDPIMTMDAPVADDTALYDQLNPPVAQTPLPRRERRRMKSGDKFLLCMGVGVIGLGTVAYGMAVYGWGAGPMPADEAVKPAHVVSAAPTVLPTTGPVEPYQAPAKAPVSVVDPTHYSPAPEHTITVVSPTPEKTTSAPVAPVETSRSPEPSPTHESPSTPPPSPTPTPSESASPSQSSLLPSLLTSPPASPPEATDVR
jgi:hypothetical protein